MKFFLDGIDISAELAKQATIADTDGGVYPDEGTKWFDLLGIINQNPTLQDSFFNKGGLHVLKIQNDAGYQYTAKIILRATYSARNC